MTLNGLTEPRVILSNKNKTIANSSTEEWQGELLRKDWGGTSCWILTDHKQRRKEQMSVCVFVFAETAGCILITLNYQIIPLAHQKRHSGDEWNREGRIRNGGRFSVFSIFVGFLSSSALILFISSLPTSAWPLLSSLLLFVMFAVGRHFTAKLSSISVPLYESHTHTHIHTPYLHCSLCQDF